jgi:hypothetical protein
MATSIRGISLASLTDVLITTPTDGQVLTYEDTDAKWENEAGGGGGGTPASPDTSIQFNAAGSFGGDARLLWVSPQFSVGLDQTVTPNDGPWLHVGPAIGEFGGASEGYYYTVARAFAGTLTSTVDEDSVSLVLANETRGDPDNGIEALAAFVRVRSGDSAFSASAVLYGVELNGPVTSVWSNNTNIFLKTGGDVTNLYGTYTAMYAQGGTAIKAYAYWATALEGVATHPYSFWSDEQGVFRIRSDNTFDSVYQAIPALYNPLFTKYVAGAANFERWVTQWHTNVLEMGAEAGGTGVLRAVKILGASLDTPAILTANGAAVATQAYVQALPKFARLFEFMGS